MFGKIAEAIGACGPQRVSDVKISILSVSDVSGSYAATLMERGHKVIFGPYGHVSTSVANMIEQGVDGILLLNDDDANFREIAALFTKATGRPTWRNLTEIPR